MSRNAERPQSSLNLRQGLTVSSQTLNEQWLSTTPTEMYDFDMRRGFPTPAFVNFMARHERRAVDWMGDYFNRLCRAHNLSYEECARRVRECFDDMYHADRRDDQTLILDMRWAADAVRVTDLQTIDRDGIRRPRASVVDRFEESPRRARGWLRYRMVRTQTDLGLDPDEMLRTKSVFLRKVSNELRRRRLYGR